MKYFFFFLSLLFFFLSCKEEGNVSSSDPVNWDKRTILSIPGDSLQEGSSYLSVYSQIYSQTEHRTHDLTATVSMRNINKKDTVYIAKAEYFDTKGKLIRTYFNKPIYIAPLETVEIVIDEKDQAGGTGANFLFDWVVKAGVHEPYFEGVMISTSGSQGLSFTTKGQNIQ
ncbi:DUF3124 domain-containing protein [Zeaxanthinibacter enoshimensis]|uniref:Uncharacterized protein DUF3124 n=1 Tax=Zeaxanthinibacter enoshimensis TaxID=392009 RepID=A0A4R6TQ46_9FLAO|nr:DUF3124 domain-containing protein [Zeaxanthinibacter enoshimensis]TDQ32223.1 uncharacterized protein DUF3124 [Zeaxanthinibacter enoshimensis]